jgi:23S rRNA pseudouridine1911/1915/1917 synthase
MQRIIAKADTETVAAGLDPIELTAAGAAGERLDRFLAAQLPQFSRTRLQRWIAMGAVRWDERLLDRRHRLCGLERITVEPQVIEAEQAFGPEPVPFVVHHEDSAVVVVDKSSGLVVHPAAGHWSGTLLNGLLHRYPGQSTLPRAGIVHRLDRDTSGLMVVARTESAMSILGAQLADRSMGRRYLAIVQGEAPASGDIEASLGRDPGNRLRFAVLTGAGARHARTEFRRIASGRIGARKISLIECRLHTGRTHQIRVHMKHVGMPIVGDTLYGGFADPSCPRQALHAWRLSLRHPELDRWVRWCAAPPRDITELAACAGIDLGECLSSLANAGEAADGP